MAYPMMLRRPRKSLHRPYGLSGILDFPSAQDAVNYVKAKVGEFLGLPIRFKRAFERLTRIKDEGKRIGNNTVVAKATLLERGVGTLQSNYPAVESKVTSLLSTLKSMGLGLLPLIVVGLAIAAAGAVAFQLTSIKKLELEIDAAEKGLKLPSTFDFFGGLGNVVGWLPFILVAGGGVYLLTRNK